MRLISDDADRRESAEVAGIAMRFAPILEGRLQMADALVRYLTATDASSDGELLRRHLQGSEAFLGVALVPWAPGPSEGAAPPDHRNELPTFSAAERLALTAGESVIEVVMSGQHSANIYLAHEVNGANGSFVGFFELAPGWLWQSVDELPHEVTLAAL